MYAKYLVIISCLGLSWANPAMQVRGTRDLGPIPVSEGVAKVEKVQVTNRRSASPPEHDSPVVIVESEPQHSKPQDDPVNFNNVNIKAEKPPHSAPPDPHRPNGHKFCDAGFSVRKAGRNTRTSVTKVHFDEVITNAGGWDHYNSEFKPNCAGTYYFSFHGVSSHSDFTLALMKNGQYQVTSYGTKQSYETGSNSVLLFLNPGDTVYLELQQGSLYEHPYNEAYNTFTGFLVNKF